MNAMTSASRMWWILENLLDGGPEMGSIRSSGPFHVSGCEFDLVFQQCQWFQDGGLVFPITAAAISDSGVYPTDFDMGQSWRSGQDIAKTSSAAFDFGVHLFDTKRGIASQQRAVKEKDELYPFNLGQYGRSGKIAQLWIDTVVIKGMADDEFEGGSVVIVGFNIGRELRVDCQKRRGRRRM